MFVSKVLLIVLCMTVGTVAWAQFPGAGRGGAGGGIGSGRGAQRPPSERVAPTESLSPGAFTQTQLDSIEDELKLSDTQRASWTAYADRVQKLADDMSRMRFEARTARTVRGDAVMQLEQIAIGERARMTAIDEIVELARTFYAALTPEQRALADRRLAVVLTTITTGVVPRAWNDPASRGR